MEYKFIGKLTFDDFVQINRFYMKEKFFKGKTSILFIVALVLTLGHFILGFLKENKIRFLKDLLPILFIGLVILFIIRLPKILFKKYFEKDKLSQEEQTFIINEIEINISSESSFVKITKDKITEIKYDKDSIYIFVSENKSYIIKSRYLKEFNELKDFIKSNYI